MKMTRGELLDIGLGIKAVGHHTGFEFAYGLGRNWDKVEREQKFINLGLKDSEAYQVYDKERQKIAADFCQLDETGQPKRNGKRALIFAPEKMEQLRPAIDKLKAEHLDAVAEKEKQIEDYTKSLDNEIEVELYLIARKHWPATITATEMIPIRMLMKEDDSDPVPEEDDAP